LGVLGRKAANYAQTQNQLTQGALNTGIQGLSYLGQKLGKKTTDNTDNATT
jgi:hypothetical protein